MEEDVNIFLNGRIPSKLKKKPCNLNKIKNGFHAVLKNSTSQLLKVTIF
jgi:hypothetical protein